MPPPPPSQTYHVLITGYGPFSYIKNNPSWACTSPLHNAVLHTPSGATIHITVLGPTRVSYPAVLKLLPGIYTRPPRLPTAEEAKSIFDEPLSGNLQQPPKEGYDFVFHLGAGHNGSMCFEQVGHKTGYSMPGVDGVFAPIVRCGDAGKVKTVSKVEIFESERLGYNVKEGPTVPNEFRGFADGYEVFPEELRTEVDVVGLIAHLKQQGETRVAASTDAGHFLCDFICYGSLAESQRTIIEGTNPPAKRTKSLFMHVPSDVRSPFTVSELTAAVKQIVAWVCTGEAAV